MKVRALRHCDAEMPDGIKPLFEGQLYELPVDVVKALGDAVEPYREPDAKAQRLVADKAVKGPE